MAVVSAGHMPITSRLGENEARDCDGVASKRMRVLVVEDDMALADVVARGLRQAGFAVDLAEDGEAAIEAAAVNAYDVVVLDRQLPGVHGDDVCRSLLRLALPPRILMLTAAGDIDERVHGLEIGADDYLPKPFAMTELIARI